MVDAGAFSELDPGDRRNFIITDLQLAPRNARGKVEYMATFFIVKPIDMTKSSHLLWHDVPNRGSRITISDAHRTLGDIGLSSGWQGDQSGGTAPRVGRDYAGRALLLDPGGGREGDETLMPSVLCQVNCRHAAAPQLTIYGIEV